MRSFRPTSLHACFAILLFGFTITVAGAENAQRPELALQIDHGDRVLDIDYSDDGRLLASCSRDQTAKLWDTRTGELIRTLRGHVTSVNAVAISPDKSRVATGAGLVKGRVCVWDIDSGQLLRTLAGPPGAAHALEWISNTRLAAGYAAGSVVLWDVSNGEKGTELTVGTPVSHLYLSAAGDVLYAVGNPDVLGDFGALLGVGGVRAWEAATWEQKWDPIEIETGISSLATTADDSIIAIGEREGPTIHLHSAETGERIRSFEGTPPEGYALEVGALAFSPDAEHLIVGYHPVPHYPMEIIQAWDIEHTKMLGSIELDDEMGVLTEMTYIPGRPEIASTMGLALPAPAAAANTWGVSAEGGRNMFSGWRDIAANGTIFPGGDRLVAGTERTGAHIWDLAEGRIDLRLERIPDGEIRGLGILAGTEKVVGSVTLTSPNNYGGNVAVWDAMTGELIHQIEGCGHDLQAVAASPAGSKIACYCLGGPGSFSDHREQGEVRVWSTENWKLLHSFPGHTNHVLDMDFSPDGSRLITAAGAHSKHFYGGEAYLWDADTGRRLAELQRAAITGVSACAFSHDGSRVATSTPRRLAIHNASDGSPVQELSHLSMQILALAFSPDGSILSGATREGDIFLWDVASGDVMERISRSGGWVRSLSFSPNGNRLIVAVADGTVEIWSLSDRRLAATLITVEPADGDQERQLWLTATPEGYYDCALDADHAVKWRHLGNRLVPFYQFEETFRRPDLVRKALRGEKITEEPLTLQRIPPACFFLEPEEAATISGESVRVLVQATDDAEINQLKLYVNGFPVEGAKPIFTEAKPIALEAKEWPPGHTVEKLLTAAVPLPAGQSDITIRASVYDDEKNRADAVVNVLRPNVEPVLGDLYVLAVGVSQYRNPKYNLKYAADDAAAIARLLEQQRGTGYEDVHATVLTDEQARVKDIGDGLAALKQATSADTVLVFLSGHGAQADGSFYFASHDLFIRDPARTCIPWEQIVETLNDIPARKLMFADACHSGTKLGERQATNEQLAEATRRTGIVVLASSRGDEFSFENTDHGHGAFTVGLMEALQGRADLNDDRIVTLPELEIYVPRRVTQLTGGLQHPHIVTVQDFNPQHALARVQ